MADSECIFCKIATEQIPARFAYQNEDVVAFHDIQPVAPVHIVVIPRQHIGSLAECSADNNHLLGAILTVCKQVADDHNLDNGYRVVNNCGADGGQTVQHLHFHVLGGRALGWPPG